MIGRRGVVFVVVNSRLHLTDSCRHSSPGIAALNQTLSVKDGRARRSSDSAFRIVVALLFYLPKVVFLRRPLGWKTSKLCLFDPATAANKISLTVAQCSLAGTINHPGRKRHKYFGFVPRSIVYDATGLSWGYLGYLL